MSMVEGSLQTIDCSGMQGAALFAEITKAIKKQTTLPTTIEILATDENFPNEIEDWSKVSKHRVENIEKREDGSYAVRLYIEDTRPKTPAAGPSRANPIVPRPVTAISTTATTNTNIPVPPAPEPEPQDIVSGSTRIEAAPTKSSKSQESKGNLPTVPPPAPKSSANIVLPPSLKSTANPIVPVASKSSANIALPPSLKSAANPVVPAAHKSNTNIPLPPVPKSNARIDVNLINKNNPNLDIPMPAKSVPRIEIPKELLSTTEEESQKEPSVVAPLPQESTRIEAAPQKSSKLPAVIPPDPEAEETGPGEGEDNEPSIVSPLPPMHVEIPIQPSGGYATTPPPAAQQQYQDEEDFQSRESMTETGVMMSDLSGMPAERAILHLSTLVLQANNGPLQIISDAPGFDEKLKAWSQLANIFVQELQSDGARTTALLIIGQPAPPMPAPNQTQPVPITSPKTSASENRGSLCVIKNSPESLFAAVMMANAAAANGAKVDILLYSFGVELLRSAPVVEPNPLKKFFQKIIAWLSPKKQSLHLLDFKNPLSESLGYRLQPGQQPSVLQILQSANPKSVKFFVCATSLGLVKLAPFDMLKLPNMEVIDLALFTEAAKNSSFSFTF